MCCMQRWCQINVNIVMHILYKNKLQILSVIDFGVVQNSSSKLKVTICCFLRSMFSYIISIVAHIKCQQMFYIFIIRAFAFYIIRHYFTLPYNLLAYFKSRIVFRSYKAFCAHVRNVKWLSGFLKRPRVVFGSLTRIIQRFSGNIYKAYKNVNK